MSGECTSTRTSPYVNNSFLNSWLLSHFVKMKYFRGNMGTYKIGGAPRHNALGFFCWQRSFKNTHRIKREWFTIRINGNYPLESSAPIEALECGGDSKEDSTFVCFHRASFLLAPIEALECGGDGKDDSTFVCFHRASFFPFSFFTILALTRLS